MQLGRSLHRLASLAALVLLPLLVLVGAPNRAEAYPQFQFSTDNAQCTMCHFSPGGGGLINDWGRGEAADTISRGGDGGLLHGLWDAPDWMQIGGDFRMALGVKDTESAQPDTLAFPMQLDLYTRFAFGDFSLVVSPGVRHPARPAEGIPNYSRYGAREHYLMWQPKVTGPYLRAGRFYAPFGLRHADHTSYVRRDLGFYAWEETYGVSAGYLKGSEWEAHATAFVRDPIVQAGPAGGGVALMYERRIREETAAWGVQSKIQIGDDSVRSIVGGVGKLWLEDWKLLLLSELDMGVTTVDAPDADPILEGIAHLNASYFPWDGFIVAATLEAKQSDFNLRGRHAESAGLSLQYFPRAHWEIQLLNKAERSPGTHDLLSLLLLHYYL